MTAWQRAGSLIGDDIVKPPDAQGMGMIGTNGPATAVGGGTWCNDMAAFR